MKKLLLIILTISTIVAFSFHQQAFAADKNTPKEKTKKNKKRKKSSRGSIESAMIFEEPKVAVKAEDSETLNAAEEFVESATEEAETVSYMPPAEPNIVVPNEHFTQKDENLYSIARKYNIPVAQLILLNNLSSTEIKEGQKVILKGEPATTLKPETDVKNTASTAPVKKEPVATTKAAPAVNESRIPLNDDERMASLTVLIGCYAVAAESAAVAKANFLKEKGFNSGYFFIPDYEPEGKKLFRVYAGPFPDQKTAKVSLAEIQKFRETAYIFKVR